MESRAKIFGHAIHPMLVVLPLGLLVTSCVYDALHLKNRSQPDGGGEEAKMAHRLIGAGLIGGLLAAPPGWWDWLAIPAGTRAKRIGLVHGVGNVMVLSLFGASWLLRRPDPARPSKTALGLAGAGLALSGFTAWLGGELVERLGVGVDENAGLDAPSSLLG